MLNVLLLLQAAAAPAAPAPAPASAAEARLQQCLALLAEGPERAEAFAGDWRLAGGGFRARQCTGMAYARRANWTAAGGAFADAAREAEVARDPRAADLWAQAGNAWLAAGEGARARSAIDAALAAGTLEGLALGEAHLDRARILVAAGDLAGARGDLDRAVQHAADDPLAWLLSATLARRQDDLPRARTDIARAVALSPDDASVQLEAGNIAGLSGDEAGARRAFAAARRLAPGTPQANAADQALGALGPAPASEAAPAGR